MMTEMFLTSRYLARKGARMLDENITVFYSAAYDKCILAHHFTVLQSAVTLFVVKDASREHLHHHHLAFGCVITR